MYYSTINIGLLPAVQSLVLTVCGSWSTVCVNWTAPFTLDVSTDPDIAGYCVDVINSTFSETLLSECGIHGTEFIYPISPINIGCDDYTFTVTAVNIVGNGTRSSLDYSMGLQCMNQSSLLEIHCIV